MAEISGTQLAKQSLVFTQNNGQVRDDKGHPKPEILFTAHNGSANIFITGNSINYQFTANKYPQVFDADCRGKMPRIDRYSLNEKITRETHRFTLSLQNANTSPHIRKEAPQSYIENFYLSNCPQGITNVPTYARIIMEDVYPGIDWIIYSSEDGFEYDFLVHPNADPAQIKLSVADADQVNITDRGELVITTSLGEVRETSPVSFLGDKVINTKFIVNNDGTISFKPEAYDRNSTLRIDPSVNWASYYGGSGLDVGYTCTTDPSGNMYLCGATSSLSGITTSGGHQTTQGGNSMQDAFLVKFNNAGVRKWATYYGGSDDEEALSCTTDAVGHVYICGVTSSKTAITTPGSYKPAFGSGYVNAFLVQFDSIGTRQWGTYFGGDNMQKAYSCFTDASANVFISGSTSSTSGISTTGAYQTTYGGGNNDLFLAKFNSAGSIQFGTYFGGPDDDQNCAGKTDAAGNVYLTGLTSSSTGISTTGTYQSTIGGMLDAFVVKFTNAGSRSWGTYFGGASDEAGFDVAPDASGNVYLVGSTTSKSNIASSGAHQASLGGDADFFIAKFNSNGARQWSTYYGGTGGDWGNGCIVDPSGNLYVSGQSTSTSGISSNGFQNTNAGSSDAVLAKFSSTGIRQWGTYFGGPGDDRALKCALDVSGNIILAGMTSSLSGIATGSAFQTTYGGGAYDAFITRIIPTTTNVPVVNEVIGCSTYPNPVSQSLVINLKVKAIQAIGYKILDITGRTVTQAEAVKYEAGDHTIQLTVAAWPSGLYFLKLLTNGESPVVKFIKQ